MIPARNILIASFPEQSIEIFQRLVRNALFLKRWWSSTLHIILSSFQRELFKQIIGQNSSVILHENREPSIDFVLDIALSYSCDLIVIAEKPSAANSSTLETKTLRAILEKSAIPVLVLPENIEFSDPPIGSFTVPLSGEKHQSEALYLALKLAQQTKTPVDILHVTPLRCPCSCGANLETISDEVQHEYPALVEKIIATTCPLSGFEERDRVRYFWQASGFTSEEIMRRSLQSPQSVFVIEWKGSFEPGHGDIVKTVLQYLLTPILFIKVQAETRSLLKFGKDFKAA